MDVNNLSFGQRIDPKTGMVEPWFTHGALDRIKSMDLSDKEILMYGAGLGDAYLAKRCKYLISIERNPEWGAKADTLAINNSITNYLPLYRPCNDCSGMDAYYTEFPKEMQEPDVIIVDDAYRYECIVKAVEYAKSVDKDVILVVDNWQQDYVFICPAAEELLKDRPIEIHRQQDHKDHSGKPWQTLIAYL
jgi:hypothetical protein